jgi:hypothetical protein
MSKPGPSGKPMIHTVECKSKADAKNKARSSSPGSSNSGGHIPEFHKAHKEGQKDHAHPTNAQGVKDFGAAHFEFGKKK